MTTIPVMRPTNKVPPFVKVIFKVQMFFIRRGMMGERIMIITTTGRKSGKHFSTPIGFVRDGDKLYALNRDGSSNWYKNALASNEATLEIGGKVFAVYAEAVTDEAERSHVFHDLYQKSQAMIYKRLGPNYNEIAFIRFTPKVEPNAGITP